MQSLRGCKKAVKSQSYHPPCFRHFPTPSREAFETRRRCCTSRSALPTNQLLLVPWWLLFSHHEGTKTQRADKKTSCLSVLVVTLLSPRRHEEPTKRLRVLMPWWLFFSHHEGTKTQRANKKTSCLGGYFSLTTKAGRHEAASKMLRPWQKIGRFTESTSNAISSEIDTIRHYFSASTIALTL